MVFAIFGLNKCNPVRTVYLLHSIKSYQFVGICLFCMEKIVLKGPGTHKIKFLALELS